MHLLQPIVDILAHRILAGTFLNLAFRLFALASNFIEIVILRVGPES